MKPRLALMREGPARGYWRCMSRIGPAGFARTPRGAYAEWRKWQGFYG